jgi:peptide/nickel transport system substrate-binding protein
MGTLSNISDRRVSRRDVLRYGAGGAAVAIAAPLAGAATASASTLPRRAARPAAKRGGTLKFARSIAPTTLDPANTIIAGDVYTLDKVMEPLYITNPAGGLVPWLATSHKISNGGKTYSFKLRPGVKFSNGKPLTAEDVAFSINRARLDQAGPLSFLDYAIKSVQARSSSEVVVNLSQAWAPFLSDISVFANAVFPANFGGKKEAAFFKAPIGTGPFMVTPGSFVPDGPSLTLKRNPHYWQPGKPYLDAVDFIYNDNDQSRVLQVEGGQAQIIDLVPPSSVSSLRANPRLRVGLYAAWQVDLLVMNQLRPHFKDRHVRRAITYAINRPALVKATSFGTAKPGGSFFPPSLQYYSPHTPVLGFSVAKAKAELAMSNYPKGFSCNLLIDGGVQKWVEIAQIIKSDLAAININVNITPLGHSAFEATFRAFNFDMFIDYAINDISDPDEMASFEVDEELGGSNSYWSHYKDPTAINLVRKAEAELDSHKRAAYYAEIQKVVAEDAPFVPLDYPPYIYAISKSVNGFDVNPGGAYRLENVWLA